MSKGDLLDERGAPLKRPAASNSLTEAIRAARIVEGERIDVSADRRDAEFARLELLRGELEPMFADIPPGDDRFALTLSATRPARLWIDMFAYVAMDDDTTTYQLIRNGDDGRRVLFSSTDIGDMRTRIASYIARQIVLKERQEAGFTALVRGDRDEPQQAAPKPRSRAGAWIGGFLIGAISAVCGLLAYAWITLP